MTRNEHREPWEVISLVAATYLGLYMMHCVFVVMETADIIVRHEDIKGLKECIEIPLLL